MYLYKLFAAYDLYMCPHLICNLMDTHCTDRKLHSKQIVCITAKGFSVEEITPPSQDLTCYQSDTGRIQHNRK